MIRPVSTLPAYAAHMSMGICRECEAPIHFAQSENGKTMVIDPIPVPDGTVRLVIRDGVRMAVVLKKGETYGGALYKVHQATCPALQKNPEPVVNPLDAVKRVRAEVEAERAAKNKADETVDDPDGEDRDQADADEPDAPAEVRRAVKGRADRQAS